MKVREVKDLSIEKWEFLKKRADVIPSTKKCDIDLHLPYMGDFFYKRLRKCLFNCPLCQMFRARENNGGEFADRCDECPVKKNTVDGYPCFDNNSDFTLFIHTVQGKETRKQLAQNIIDAIRQWDITGIEDNEINTSDVYNDDEED
jgi:transposase-like protein